MGTLPGLGLGSYELITSVIRDCVTLPSCRSCSVTLRHESILPARSSKACLRSACISSYISRSQVLVAIKVVKLIVFRTCARDFIKNKKSPRSRAGPLMSESFRTLLNRTFFNAILILVSNLILSLGHHSPNISLSFSASATIFTGFCFLSFCRFTIFHFTEG